MRVTCPWCGDRDVGEFDYAGPALARPAPDAPEQDWLDYLYLRENPVGWRIERWRHAKGCRLWFTLERHTQTHERRDAPPEEGA